MLGVQELIDISGAAIIAMLGWFARQLHDNNQKLRDDLQMLQVTLPTDYVRRDEYGKTMERIEAIVAKIFDKLDTKADK